MNKYTFQRTRQVNETIDEYIVIDDLKLREYCAEIGIDFDEFDLEELGYDYFDELWELGEEWEGVQFFHAEGDECVVEIGINAGERWMIGDNYFNLQTKEIIK